LFPDNGLCPPARIASKVFLTSLFFPPVFILHHLLRICFYSLRLFVEIVPSNLGPPFPPLGHSPPLGLPWGLFFLLSPTSSRPKGALCFPFLIKVFFPPPRIFSLPLTSKQEHKDFFFRPTSPFHLWICISLFWEFFGYCSRPFGPFFSEKGPPDIPRKTQVGPRPFFLSYFFAGVFPRPAGEASLNLPLVTQALSRGCQMEHSQRPKDFVW